VKSQDNSVGIALGYRLEFNSWMGQEFSFPYDHILRSTLSNGYKGLSPGGKK